METASPKVGLICVHSTSANNSQNGLRISEETILITLNSLHHSDTYSEKPNASGK
jgi:hypothetical protein